MNRILILPFLAIVFATFALEAPTIILRATKIGGESMMLEWSELAGAKTYKVFYDEDTLVNPKNPEPLLESQSLENTEVLLDKMLAGTDYYLVVRGYDEKGTQVGATIPLHARTLNMPIFSVKFAHIQDEQHIEVVFSRPINLEKSDIQILHADTKKARSIAKMQTSDTDLRVVVITLEGKIAPDTPHAVHLVTVTDIDGDTYPVESKKTIDVTPTSSSTETTPMDTPAVSVEKDNTMIENNNSKEETSSPSTIPEEALEKLRDEVAAVDVVLESESILYEPVPIDTLPQTGSSTVLFLLLALLGGAYSILCIKKS